MIQGGPKTRITLRQYRAMRDDGYSDQEIADNGLEVDALGESLAAGRKTPAQTLGERGVPNAPGAKDWAMVVPKAVGKAALMSAQSIPVAGPLATRALGLQDELADARKELGGLGTLGEVVQGVAAGSTLLKAANGLSNTSRAARLAKLALGGSQNIAGGKLNALKRFGTNVVVGSGVGAAHGAAADADDPSRGAAVGGVVGGLAGAIPSVAGGMKGAYTWARDKVSPARTAIRELQDFSRVDLEDLAGRIHGARPGDILGDVTGKHTTGRLRTAISDATEEGTTAQRALASREPQAEAVGDLFFKHTNAPSQGVRGQVESIEQQLQPEIGRQYKEAFEGTPEVSDKTVLQIVKKHKGLKMARRAVNATYKALGLPVPGTRPSSPPAQVGFNAEPPTKVSRVPVSLEYLDELKRQADKIASGPPTKISVLAQRGAKDLTDALDAVHPEYTAARAAAAEKLSAQEAAGVGAKAARGKDVRDLPVAIQQIAPKGSAVTATSDATTADAARQAVGQELLHRLRNTKSVGSAIDLLADRQNSREVTRAAFPDDASFQKFESEVMDMLRTVVRNEAMRGNSGAVKIIQEDSFGMMTPWSVAQALKGAPELAASQLVGGVHRAITKRVETEAGKHLARLATTKLKDSQGVLTDRASQLLAELQRKNPNVFTDRRMFARLQGAFRPAAAHDPEQ